MKRLLSLFVAGALLVGCSQRDICISNAQGDLPVKERLAAQTRGNIARGYAIDRVTVNHPTTEPCELENSDGDVIRTLCPIMVERTRRVPRAIDIEAERVKLRSLEQRIAQDRRLASQAIAQCQALYPDS